MMKYDELIKDLRICASTFCESCEKCSHSNEHGDCYNGLKRSAADAIEGLLAVIQRQKEMINATAYLPLYPKPMKWIPVTERLPENDKTVLVWNRRNSREYFDVYDHGRWIILESEDITHWMPLPEPPKEETDG